MELPEFIRSLAPDDVEAAIDHAAKLFDAKPGAVKAWLYRERIPRPATARRIVTRAGGKLTLEDIYTQGPPQ